MKGSPSNWVNKPNPPTSHILNFVLDLSQTFATSLCRNWLFNKLHLLFLLLSVFFSSGYFSVFFVWLGAFIFLTGCKRSHFHSDIFLGSWFLLLLLILLSVRGAGKVLGYLACYTSYLFLSYAFFFLSLFFNFGTFKHWNCQTIVMTSLWIVWGELYCWKNFLFLHFLI